MVSFKDKSKKPYEMVKGGEIAEVKKGYCRNEGLACS